MRLTATLPNCITSTTICLSFAALLAIHHNHADVFAACILLGILLDGLDGYVARCLNACSAFGKQLDNLADMSLFCIVPAVLLYTRSLEPVSITGAIIGTVYLLCGALRLARFAASEHTMAYFEGLPTPGAALIVLAASAQPNTGLTTALALICSGLMISRWPMLHPVKFLECLRLPSRRRAPDHQLQRELGHPMEETYPPAIQI